MSVPITTWRQRCERFNDGHITTTNDIQMVMQEEISELRADIERLYAEIEARKVAVEKVYLEQAAEIERLTTANDYAFTELTNARAEIERLRAVLQEIAAYPHSEEGGEIARAALEQKP